MGEHRIAGDPATDTGKFGFIDRGICMNNKRRYQLDVFGTFYACVNTRQHHNTFRFTAVLTEEVEPAMLQRALDATLTRCPYFAVSLRAGLASAGAGVTETPWPMAVAGPPTR